MSAFFGSTDPGDRRWMERWVRTLPPRAPDSPQNEELQPDGTNPVWKISLEDILALLPKPQEEVQEPTAQAFQYGKPQEEVQEPITTVSQCGICFDDLLEGGSALRIPGCDHAFCGECLHRYVVVKVHEQQYPIKCPGCIAVDGTAHSDVDQATVEKLSLSDLDRSKLDELQLTIHAIFLHCPSCKSSMLVDRQDYAANNALFCPLPHCQYKWCRDCTRRINPSDVNHRCTNKKLDRLMRRKGWRYCPGCQTPIQKDYGCNHMTCESPGCSVHFCYRCGDLIIDASKGGNISQAVSDHYTRCVQRSSRAYRVVSSVRSFICIHL